MKRFFALAFVVSCAQRETDICPVDTPNFSAVVATVTEGSSVVVPLYADGAIPSGGVSGQLDTDDHTVATLSPNVFAWSTSGATPHVTITGVDDGVADVGLRETQIGGVVLDCGGEVIGGVYVVDRESLNVLADPWDPELASGVTTTTFNVTLTQAPGSDVSLALSGPGTGVMVTPSSIALGPDNWDTGVVATVTGVGSGWNAIWLGTGSDSGLPPYYYVYVYADP
jgi:hypothetical protein